MSIEVPAARVLMIDEDRALSEYVQGLLEREGYKVTHLDEPSRLEEEARSGGHQLVLVDRLGAELDGAQALRRVRAVVPNLPVVLFSSSSEELARQALELEAAGYVRKPVNVDELREVVARVSRKSGGPKSAEDQLHRVIGDIIRNRRRDKELTLKHMARRTGLSVSLLSQIERAESSASIASLYKIATALESKMQDLFGQY